MDSFVSIRDAAQALGASITPLRRRERDGKLVPAYTSGDHHRDDLAKWCPERFRAAADVTRRTVAYARVSSHDQKYDRERHGACQGWNFEVVADFGSGMNDHKKGLKRLLNDILTDQVGRLVMTHMDPLLCFGAELVFAIGAAKRIEGVILNQGKDTTLEEELAQDALEIITVFSARI